MFLFWITEYFQLWFLYKSDFCIFQFAAGKHVGIINRELPSYALSLV